MTVIYVSGREIVTISSERHLQLRAPVCDYLPSRSTRVVVANASTHMSWVGRKTFSTDSSLASDSRCVTAVSQYAWRSSGLRALGGVRCGALGAFGKIAVPPGRAERLSEY